MCRRGARLTEEYAAARGIPVERTGKLLVATTARELAGLGALRERAAVNRIEAEVIDGPELRRREPHVHRAGRPVRPVHRHHRLPARSTEAFADDVRGGGGELRTATAVTGVHESGDEVRLETTTGEVRARQVVFCAGVQSDRMARLAGIDVDFRIVPFRGEYYDVVPAKADLVSHLIYPVPDPELPFLGVHLTRTVDGGLNVGPNAVLGLAREKYARFSFDRRDALDIVRFPGMWRVARQHARTGLRELRNSASKRAYLAAVPSLLPRAGAGRPDPARGRHPGPGGAARRVLRARLPAQEHAAHPPRRQRALAGGDLSTADRRGDRAPPRVRGIRRRHASGGR